MTAAHSRRRLSRAVSFLLLALSLGLTPAIAAADHASPLAPSPSVDCPDARDGRQESLRRGVALLRQARHEAARTAFTEFLGPRPDRGAWRAVANAYLAEGQLADAIAALQEMRRVDADQDLHQILRSLILVLESPGTRAAAALSEAIRRTPNARLYNLLGQQFERLGRNLEAIRAYAHAAGLEPGEPRYWQSLGEAYERVGHHTQALEAFREAVALGASAHAWSAIGRLHLEERYFVAAVQAYQEAVRLAPGDLDALVGLGIAYGAQKDWPAALETYYKVKAQEPAAAEELFGIIFRGKKT